MDYQNIRHSTTHPNFLHSNSTSHKFAFGAVAELVDNSVDAEATVLKIEIGNFEEKVKAEKADTGELTRAPSKQEKQKKEIEIINLDSDSETETPIPKVQVPPTQLIFTDNGTGMDEDHLHKMLSFGHCEKVEKDGKAPIGHYGNGFKSGSMRLGKNVIVFTKNGVTRTVGLLSQTFLKEINAVEVLVPLAAWEENTGKWCLDKTGMERDLKLIHLHSPFKTEAQLDEQFAEIQTRGTRIIVFELSTKEGDNESLEFNFIDDTNNLPDIQLQDDIDSAIMPQSSDKNKRTVVQKEPNVYNKSLRAYLSILYLYPKMQIILRGKKVHSKRLLFNLYKPAQRMYTPKDSSVSIPLTYGFSKHNFRTEYGLMMYNKGRLIKAFLRVGIQLNPASPGIGVMGIVDTTLVQPTHNKQDFIYDKNLNLLINNMKQNLSDYWNSLNIPSGGLSAFFHKVEKAAKLGPFFIQCGACLKWRHINKRAETYTENWVCAMNEDDQFNNCGVPEEDSDHITASKQIYRRKRKAKAIESLEAQELRAKEAWLKKVEKVREAKAKKIAKELKVSTEKVKLALKVCENDETAAKDWLEDHDAYSKKELYEMYGNTNVEELDDASLEAYNNAPEEATEDTEDAEDSDTHTTTTTTSTTTTRIPEEFITDSFTSDNGRYPARQRKSAVKYVASPHIRSTSPAPASTIATKKVAHFNTKKSVGAKSPIKSIVTRNSNSNKRVIPPTKTASQSKVARREPIARKKAVKATKKQKKSASYGKKAARLVDKDSEEESDDEEEDDEEGGEDTYEMGMEDIKEEQESDQGEETEEEEGDDEQDINMPPGMDAEVLNQLKYKHPMHYSTKCKWCHLLCDKLRTIFEELCDKPVNCGEALDEDVDLFIKNIKRKIKRGEPANKNSTDSEPTEQLPPPAPVIKQEKETNENNDKPTFVASPARASSSSTSTTTTTTTATTTTTETEAIEEIYIDI